MAERVGMSKNIFEGLLNASSDIWRFQITCVKLEGSLGEFGALKIDLRRVEMVAAAASTVSALHADSPSHLERLNLVDVALQALGAHRAGRGEQAAAAAGDGGGAPPRGCQQDAGGAAATRDAAVGSVRWPLKPIWDSER